MARIRIESSWPETNLVRITLTHQDSEFTKQQLEVVKAATEANAGFDGRSLAIIWLVYTSDLSLRPAKEVFDALRQAIPSAQFETRDANLKNYLGNGVTLLY